jgi:hypothetical protein
MEFYIDLDIYICRYYLTLKGNLTIYSMGEAGGHYDK